MSSTDPEGSPAKKKKFFEEGEIVKSSLDQGDSHQIDTGLYIGELSTNIEATGAERPPTSKRKLFKEETENLKSSLDQEDSQHNEIGLFNVEVIREGPPAKKSKVFEGETEIVESSLDQEALKQNEKVSFIGKLSYNDEATGNPGYCDCQRNVTAADDYLSSQAQIGGDFDQESFETFIGGKVAPGILRQLREASGDDLERAVNMYFDGSWASMNLPLQGPSARSNLFIPSSKTSPGVDAPLSTNILPKTKVQTPKSRSKNFMPDYRYIGAFGVGAWATRSGAALVKHGESIRIERQNTHPPRAPVLQGNKHKNLATPALSRPNSAAAKRVDVVVRFSNSRGEEVGRLPRDIANWVSTLIDQKICKFEGICVFAPDRIRINDTIFLQLRCSMLRTAFDSRSFLEIGNRNTGIFEEKETLEERNLRLRQVALVRLFEEINLLPSKTSEAATKHKRHELLQAAEVSDRNDREGAKKFRLGENESPSPPSEEAEEGKLEQDQLDALYRKAQSFDFNSPVAEPAETFAMELRHYQKQALFWMIAKEKNKKDESKDQSMHPLWEEYSWPAKDADDIELPLRDQKYFYVNPYSGDLSLNFPVHEQHCQGGILADEMGLGKTIEMLSLIHSHKSDAAMKVQLNGSIPTSVNNLPRLPTNPSVEWAPCTTLVVAPMSLLAQWQSEAENASKDGTLRTMIYYGSEKTGNLQNLCCEANAASAPNVLITSYGVVLSEFNRVSLRPWDRGAPSGLFSLRYFRVILDEAHHIKNRQSKTAKACYEIAAEHRWVLTGTPIVNRLEDLFSLVRFLHVEPWSNFSFWKTFITAPFESKDFMRALDVVQTVLEPLVLRRTKEMKTPNGEALVPLPPKTIDIIDIELSKPERDVYDYIFARAKRTFAANVEAGTVMKAYTHIFAQILRLRQSCCHPLLVRSQNFTADEDEAGASDEDSGFVDDVDLRVLIERFTTSIDDDKDTNAFGVHALEQIRDEADNECPICAEESMVEQTVTGCWHSACKKCLFDYISHQTDKGVIPRCFSCREVINTRDIFEVIKHEDEIEFGTGKFRISLQRTGSNSSAKIGALLNQLKLLKQDYPGTKSVVFSQFTSFLSLIEGPLKRASIPFLRLDGSMAQKTRVAVLREFSSSKKGIVLLLSLRAGGVGLNLTMAKRVYMMDPWWSFAVEAQAIDRVHRMGQTDEVRVYRFIVKESVEERMLKVQDKKKFIATSLGMMSDEEKRLQRIEDIKELLT